MPEVRKLYRWAAVRPVDLSYSVSGRPTTARELIIQRRNAGEKRCQVNLRGLPSEFARYTIDNPFGTRLSPMS